MPATEIQTDAIVRHALGAGKHVYVPYLHKASDPEPGTPARVMDMVHLRSIEDYEGLKRDAWGIPSIDPSTVHERRRILGGPDTHHSDQSTLDLMLLPGVAFDVDVDSGVVGRLGHGKGFYDFFLNRYMAKAKQPLQLYGLALTEQILPESSEYRIPIGPYDRRLHGLILGDGNIVSLGGTAVTDD
jgi:5-formyltetrahydrofolate cyclo-ligase